MKLIPKSIVARVTWLVASVGFISFILHGLVITFWMRPVFDDVSTAIAGQVSLARVLVLQTEGIPKVEEIQKQLPQTMVVAASSIPFQGSSDNMPFMAKPAIDLLRSKLPNGVVMHHPDEMTFDSPRRFHFDFEHQGLFWRISYSIVPPIALLIGSILGWLFMLAVAVSASLYFGVRLVTRPMSDIAERIAAQRNHLAALPLPTNASEEIRTMVLAFNQLVLEVRSADEKKMQMLAGLSHDLRTPLTRLRLRAEIEMSGRQSEAFNHDIASMQKMIDQFMAYVHGAAHAGLGNMESVALQLARLASHYPEDVCHLNISFTERNLSLPNLGFSRLMSNLIDNAFAHGIAPIELEYKRHSLDRKNYASVTVFDSGKGMSTSEFEQARQPFVRLREGMDIGHSGLGLAIASQMAEQLGGHLSSRYRSDGMFGVEFLWLTD